MTNSITLRSLVLLLALPLSWAATAHAQTTNGLLREVYNGTTDATLASLLTNPNFPDRPTSSELLTHGFEAPTDVADYYGQRLRGYVLPPTTGDYVFWIASDDASALYLSTDDQPANTVPIASVNSWTSPREWGKEPNQQSSPIRLEAGRAYYVEALMVEAGGGDNLAVKWRLPGGVEEEPIPTARLYPWGTSFSAPTIATQPTNTTAGEGGVARFSVKLTAVGLFSFQWQRNGASITGATQPDLLYSPVLMSDQQARFRCVITNRLGSVTSTEAVLTVTGDTTPPTLVAAENQGTTQLEVTFSEPVAPTSALQAAHFSIDKDITVFAAAAGAASNKVLLTTSPMALGQVYTLTVSDVTDQAQIPNVIIAGSKITFGAAEYQPKDIGSPPLSGNSTPGSGGMNVTGSGDLGGASDSFQFAWRQLTGDFDQRARLMDFEPTDPFAMAGLMARESLTPTSRFVASLATPAMVGCFSMARQATGAAAARSGFLPANYPETWLRLKRAGNVFIAYASLDGQAWVELSNTSLALPTTVYFGLAVASHNGASVATASFRDLGLPAGATVATYSPRGESLGPSARQTPLVISEIMYHPKERADGRNGEFIEVFNADLIPQDLTGHRISGSVEYAFPDGFVLPAGAFAVIARNPADFMAIYGQAALGPFANTNNLPNDTGSVRLRNARGAILLEVIYGSKAPWPVAASGGGHSLILARPSYGEADPRAWAASDVIGGSPGAMEAVRANPLASVVINEFLAHTDDPMLDYVELYNHGNQTVDVSGGVITDDPTTNRFRIPNGTSIPPRSFLAFDQNSLGFRLNAKGESLFLVNSNLTRVVDAVRFDGQENGVATGRYPDGASEFRRLTRPTPGAKNEPFLVSDIVLNELMYHPISGDSDDEFVELYNRTIQAVDLSGWRFTDGIDYTFPAGTTLAGQAYLAVAKNRVRLLANYPGIDASLVFGDFDGTLAHGGERVAIAKPDWIVSTNESGLLATNRIYIEVDDVRYGTGGRWGQWSDGLGSSLELIDANSDHLQPANWADSDESAKAPWSTIEFTGLLDNGDGGAIDRLQVMLQGQGECLVDDVEVLSSGNTNRLTNPSFNTGLGGWTIQGNHRNSGWDTLGGVGNSGCLHVRSPGRGDTAVNRIYTPISPALVNNSTATLRAKVRWLKGWPEFMLRLRGNYLEAAGRMALPTNLGTPAARNSRAVRNAGPAIFDVVHAPILPAGAQAVTVTARASDPDRIGSVTLKYRADPGTTVQTVVMTDDGAAGDAVAGDGVYSGRIPGQSAGVKVAFYVSATDALASGASTSLFPADAPTHECLVRWGETQPVGNLGVYRLWQRQADYNWLRSREPMANDNVDCTFVYNDGRVIYNAEMRGKGSPWHGGSVGTDYLYAFPEDDRFLGARDVALVTVGNGGNDDSAQREQAAFWIGREMGLPSLHRRHVYFFENGARKQTVYEDTEEPNGFSAAHWWPDGQDGDLYKVEDWFEYNDAGNSFTFSHDATLEKFTTTGGAYKTARYRWAWRKRAVTDSANNYTNLFNLVTALNLGTIAYVPQVENLVDVENWLGIFALQHIVGNWDAYGYSRGKNAYIYKQVNGRFGMVPWDIDFVLGSGGDGPTTDIFGANDPTVGRLWSTATFRRTYLRAILDACAGPLQGAEFDPLVDGRFAALTANGVNVASPQAIKTWVSQRRTYLLNRVASENTLVFAITSNNGGDFSTNKALVTLSGSAPISVKTITVNGVPMPVQWNSVTGWTMTLALGARTNVLNLAGYDSRGKPVGGASDTITIKYTGADLPSPAGQVVINEIMYHPSVPEAEFVEIFNNSATTTFDLSRWRLNGADFTFPSGTIIAPQQYLVVVKNRLVFAATYGANIPVVGEFAGQLDHGGETLSLVNPGSTPAEDVLIDQVAYRDQLPWPEAADGFGPSLQLVDPAQDNRRAGNWASAATNATVRFTPGAANSVRTTLPAFPLVWLNEVQPENLNGQTDQLGEHDPWLELYNSGTNVVNLSGYFLSDSFTNLTRWSFPVNAAINPGQFVVVWADGETNESTASEWHTSFRLNPGTDAVALSRLQNGPPAVMDYLTYKNLSPGQSYGDYPDGQPHDRQVFHYATAAGTNNPASMPVKVYINEWMANNTRTLSDPADGQFEDWFELYNAGTNRVDLTGYRLTDELTNTTKFVIPAGTIIEPAGYLLVWADQETAQNNPANPDLHVDFKLSQSGEVIALFAPDSALVDSITFDVQTNDISEGRWPDGAAPSFFFMNLPTPGSANVVSSTNRPPVLTPIGNKAINELAQLTFTASATDSSDGQMLTFSLAPGAPAGTSIDPVTGLFVWTPTEAQGPGTYPVTVRVSDNGTPAMIASERVTVTVNEVNSQPAMSAIGDRTIQEGSLLGFTVRVSDPDLPLQTLTYTLGPGAPAGAAIDSAGEFTWIPSEAQEPGTYLITVRVADNGIPPFIDEKSFTVTVSEVNSVPVLNPIGNKVVDEGTKLIFQASASDPDLPQQTLTFSLDAGAPAGAVIDPATGLFSWAPTAAQIPSTNQVTVRVTDNGAPNLTASETFTILATKPNRPPVLSPLSDRSVDEGSLLTIKAEAADSDSNQTLTFSLDPGAPAGAAIIPATGAFTWTPSEAQGPGTNIITIRVHDDGVPSVSDAKTFTVVVREVNTAPVLTNIPNQDIAAGATLSLPISAQDADLPPNQLTYVLEAGAPADATINATNGLFAWTPAYDQALSTNRITVRVSDNGSPSLSATNTFTVIVNPPAPSWRYVSLTGTASASVFYVYLNSPGDLYLDDLMLVPGDKPGVGTNALANGDFENALSGAWTVSPNHANSAIVTNVQHAGKASLHVIATSGGTTRASSIFQDISPALVQNAPYTLSFWYLPGTNATILTLRLSGFGISSTNDIVPLTNRPPILAAIANQTVKAGQKVSFTVAAFDLDLPPQALTYRLDPGAPTGASLNATNGLFSWTPLMAQISSAYLVTARVTDNGTPSLSSTRTFTVAVERPEDLKIQLANTATGTLTFNLSTIPGKTYQIQYKNDLSEPAWIDGSAFVASGTASTVTNLWNAESPRFFRVKEID